MADHTPPTDQQLGGQHGYDCPPSTPDDQTALRDRIAEVLAVRFTADGDISQGMRVIDPDGEEDAEPARRVRPLEAADAVLAVLPPPADQAAEAPAAECSAQNRNYESGPRLCIRAAQHTGDHIDERGFHWSDTVAVYPLADGTFRAGVNRAVLRRLAAEAQQPTSPTTFSPDEGVHGRDPYYASSDAETQQQPDTETHSCSNCDGIGPDTCLMNPDRPKRPMDPVHILGIYAADQEA